MSAHSKITGHHRIVVGENFYLGANSHLKSMTSTRGHNEKCLVIGDDVFINENTIIDANHYVEIGSGTIIGPMCLIIDSNHNFADESRPIRLQGSTYRPVVIGRGAWIGAHSIILPGVTIGDNAVVAANSTVTRSVDAGAVVGGSPARLLRVVPN